jgi:hypothetical protein
VEKPAVRPVQSTCAVDSPDFPTSLTINVDPGETSQLGRENIDVTEEAVGVESKLDES